jgi:L-alanine-DL-glutamate epimerase-like enolase superfamily enzyme
VKVAGVEAIPLAYEEPNDAGGLRHVCLARITDDEGEVGWGEAVTIWREATLATVEVIRGLAEIVVGQEVAAIDRIWQSIADHTWWYGVGGIASFAHSALDMALWDLHGKQAGLRVLDLLGGSVHERLPALVSSHAMYADLDAMTQEMAGWVASAKADGIKVGIGKRGTANLGFDHDRDVDFVRRLRNALGPDPKIMIDVGARIHWDLATAVRRTRAFEESELYWIEEPLGADDPEGYAELRTKVTTRIAYGEREWTVRALDRLVRSAAVDVVGIDPGRVEGITGFWRASQLVAAAKREANAHSWAGPISYQAALAVSHASAACKQFEFQPIVNPLHRDLAEATRPQGGRLAEPHGLGLGLTVDQSAVRHYRIDV